MLNGCYDMHLYCDTPTCKNHRAVSEYQGTGFREAWKSARADGWHRHRSPLGGWFHYCGECKNSPLFSGDHPQ